MRGKRTVSEIDNEETSKKKKLSTSNPIDEQVENKKERTNEVVKDWETGPVEDALKNGSVDKSLLKEQKLTADSVFDPNTNSFTDLTADINTNRKGKNVENGLETIKEKQKETETKEEQINTNNTSEEKDEQVKNKTKEQIEKAEEIGEVDKDILEKGKDDDANKNKERDTSASSITGEKKMEYMKETDTGNKGTNVEMTMTKETLVVEKKDDENEEEKNEEKKEKENVAKKEEDYSIKKGENHLSKNEEEILCKNEEEKSIKGEEEQSVMKEEKIETKKEKSLCKNEEEKSVKNEEEQSVIKKEKIETKKEDKNQAKKEEGKESQRVEMVHRENNISSFNDTSKGQYMCGATGGEGKMYNMTMDNNYMNYTTNYLEQYYNTTSNIYNDINKNGVYNSYHNQHSTGISSNNTTATLSVTANNINTNVGDMKRGKKYVYPNKGSYETEYKMEDKNASYAKMQNMYLNSHINHPTNGPIPSHMINPMSGNMGNNMGGNHMNYAGSPVAPLTTPGHATGHVSVTGPNPNAAAAMPVSNNPMDNYYMYNYNYMNTPNYNNYYYMYDNKGYDYHPKEVENEKPYDFSAVIDKSLEMMKRNNKVKEILKHPARLQITPEELNKYEYTEGNDNYNIWFGKYVTDRYDKSAKSIPRFVAKYKCNPQKDSGYTKADRVYNNKQFFCIYFARGCCAYGSNCLYKHRVPTENDELEFEHTVDIFGREKFSTYKDDMSGVGCFNSDCRTLFIGSVFINNFNDAPKVEKLLYDEFSNFGNVDYVRFIPNKNIAFVQYSNRVNAEFAKVAMSDQPLENHSTALTIKWAYEFKHPPSNYTHYYNTPYIYNQSQIISPTWGNYMMQQQYGNNNTSSHIGTHINGHPSSYPNNSNAKTAYADYTNVYYAQYKKVNDRCNNINNSLHRIDQVLESQKRKGGTQ